MYHEIIPPSIQEDGETGQKLPTSVSQYLTEVGRKCQIYGRYSHWQEYNDKTKWITTNIFRFSKQLPDFQDFDITSCFEETHKIHLKIRMSWSMDEDLAVSSPR